MRSANLFGPLKGLCPHKALIGLTQASGLAGGFDSEIRNLPPEAVIHRLTGDGAKRDLLAPLWSGDKKRVLNAIHQAFLRDNLIQGSTL